MRNGFLASVLGLLVGASLVLGQQPQGPIAEVPLPESECKPAPVEPAATGPASPLHGILDGLTSRFDGNGGVFVADVEYLLWALKDASVPVPLASTNALGAPGNQILIGEQDLAYHHRPNSGLRASLAYWQQDPLPELDWDRPRTFAVEANYLFLGQRGIDMRNDTAPVLIRPFFALNTRTETGAIVAAPGLATGGVTASANYGLWGTELNLWKNIGYEYPGRTWRLDALAGFRYLDLGEDLSVTSLSVYNQQLGGVFQPFAGNQLLVNDLFHTRNQFYGGQIGTAVKFFLDVLDLNIVFKIAFGENAEEVHIDGFQFRTLANGTTVPARGGLLALPSNIGRFHGDQFTVLPEVDVLGSYAICRHVSLMAGYTFLYLGRVVRPGDQIDRVIDVTQIPNFPVTGATPTGVARPTVPFKQTDFWAQGLTVGLQFVW